MQAPSRRASAIELEGPHQAPATLAAAEVEPARPEVAQRDQGLEETGVALHDSEKAARPDFRPADGGLLERTGPGGIDRHICALRRDLEQGTWRAGEPRLKLIHEPKRRLIAAAPVRDRVLHHAVYRTLSPASLNSYRGILLGPVPHRAPS